MADNPYSPPEATSFAVEGNRGLVCSGMFCLSCVLGFVVLGIAANSAYQFWFYASRMGIALPTNILAETFCVACSGLGMFYSAIKWRRQSARAGALVFVCSLLAFFVGPLAI